MNISSDEIVKKCIEHIDAGGEIQSHMFGWHRENDKIIINDCGCPMAICVAGNDLKPLQTLMSRAAEVLESSRDEIMNFAYGFDVPHEVDDDDPYVVGRDVRVCLDVYRERPIYGIQTHVIDKAKATLKRLGYV